MVENSAFVWPNIRFFPTGYEIFFVFFSSPLTEERVSRKKRPKKNLVNLYPCMRLSIRSVLFLFLACPRPWVLITIVAPSFLAHAFNQSVFWGWRYTNRCFYQANDVAPGRLTTMAAACLPEHMFFRRFFADLHWF